jgi:LacI family transcriptional regulator
MNSSDIAKIAGVSRSTVSRVINNYGNVLPETRKKVLEAIKKYNYVPMASAQMLAGKKSRILGLFIVDTKNENDENIITSSSYFSPFTSAIIDKANKQHYNILISVINEAKDFKNAKDMFYNKTIFGGIFIGARNNETEIYDIIEKGYKVAVVEQEVKDEDDPFNKCVVINSDSFGGAYEATTYLIGLGHKKIAHVCGDMKQLTAISRLEGYKKALKDSGLELEHSLVVNGNYTEESGYRAVKKLLSESKPTAIFLANDSMSLGAIRAIQEANLRIPEDISIIGFDDIEVARYLRPALTTVRVSVFQMASICANSLIRANDKDIVFYDNYKIPVELIIRESCMEIG